MPEACLVCCNISEDSYEHVLPASLGGSLEVIGLICRKCNNIYGTELDAPLERAFRGLNTLFDITNSRTGKLFDIDFESEGQELRYQRQEHRITLAHPLPPEVKISADGSIRINLQMPAGSVDPQQNAIINSKKILRRRGFDPDKYAMDHEYHEVKHPAPSVPVRIDLDVRAASLLNRALHKIAFLAAAHLLGREHFTGVDFDEVRQVISGNSKRNIDFRPDSTPKIAPPYHQITLHTIDGLLYVLITLYGGFPYLICLGLFPSSVGNLQGLSFDPVRHSHSVMNCPETIFGDPPNRQAVERALDRVLNASMAKVQRDRLIHEAFVASGLASLSENDLITAEHLERMREELMQRLIPLIVIED